MQAQAADRRGSTSGSALLGGSRLNAKPRSASSAPRRPPAATARGGGFSDGYLRGVFDKSELPQVTRVKMRADYRFEPNTLDIMQQSAGVAMSPHTHRQVEASQGDLQLSSVPRPEGKGVHFRIRSANPVRASDTAWNEAKLYVEKSRDIKAMVRAVKTETEEAHRRKWRQVEERRLARAGEKREFLTELREKRRTIMKRLHSLVREVETLEHARSVRDQRSPRHSRHRREMHRHYKTVNMQSFPKIAPKGLLYKLEPAQHSKVGTEHSRHAAEMWRHRASMLRR